MLKIFCAYCKEHIYNYKDTIEHGGSLYCDFIKPANKNIKQPEIQESMYCPICGKSFTNEKGILTDKGFLPK